MTKLFGSIALFAVIIVMPAHAAVAPDDATRVIVKLSDLDLNRASGRAVLRQRVANGVAAFCAPEPKITNLDGGHGAGRALRLAGRAERARAQPGNVRRRQAHRRGGALPGTWPAAVARGRPGRGHGPGPAAAAVLARQPEEEPVRGAGHPAVR